MVVARAQRGRTVAAAAPPSAQADCSRADCACGAHAARA